MNFHKMSSVFLVLLLFSFAGISFILALTSQDIDDICPEDTQILNRFNGSWGCSMNTFNILHSRASISSDGYIHSGNALTGVNKGFVALGDGLITGASVTGKVRMTTYPIDYAFYFYPRVNGQNQFSLDLINVTGGDEFKLYNNSLFNNFSFLEGDVLSCYSDLDAPFSSVGSAVLEKVSCNIEVIYYDR